MGFVNRLCVVLVVAGLVCGKTFATEPHFDLPKKNAKEQCAEVERVYEECEKIMMPTDWKMIKCGNVYLDGFTTDDEDVHMVIYDKKHNIVGITVNGEDEHEDGIEDKIYYEMNDKRKYIINANNIDFKKIDKSDLKKLKKINIKNCNANYSK